MSRPLSLARVREALRLNDREKLRLEFQETVPWILDVTAKTEKPADIAQEKLKGRRRTDTDVGE